MAGGQDWVFWVIVGAMGLGVAAILARAVLRGRAAAVPAAAYDLRVYRDQLTEIDRDLARGVIGSEDAARLRAEVSRRVLDADRALATAVANPAGAGRGGLAIAGVIVVLVAGAYVGYIRLGEPGYPDMPIKARIAMAETLRATRPSQTEAEAQVPAAPPTEKADQQYLDLVAELRLKVAARPQDLRGMALLASSEARLRNYRAAYAAQAKVIALKGPDAEADDHGALAELMILAAGGYVSPQAEAALTEALKRDQQNGMARYYYGLMFAQIGRPDTAFAIWRDLFETSAPGDPWMETLKGQIEDLAAMAGVNYRLPQAAALPGPSSGDMAAAANMSDADRKAMIEGMVAQLNDRLSTQGGTAQEWARLIGAYGVLGQPENAQKIWAEAQTRFADKPADLAVVQAAAVQAGVAK